MLNLLIKRWKKRKMRLVVRWRKLIKKQLIEIKTYKEYLLTVI